MSKAGIVALVTLLSMPIVTRKATEFAQLHENQSVPIYIQKSAPRIMKDLEARAGLKFTSNPTIQYGIPPSLDGYSLTDLAGLSEGDTVYLRLEGAYTPNLNFINLIQRFRDRSIDIDQVLKHELSHQLIDQLTVQHGIPDWKSLRKNPPKDRLAMEQWISRKIIHEGIAGYLTGEITRGFDERHFPKMFEQCYPGIEYDIGSSLVAPIIERFGKKGITQLITHLPTPTQLYDLASYQRAMLQELERQGS